MTATSVHIETLLDFLSENPDLARGLVHSLEGRAKAKRLWETLTSQLNSMGGAVKTVQQWKKVWADRKYLAKKANSAARRSAGATGGGPPTADLLSGNDIKVISITGAGFGEPDIPSCRVLAFPQPAEQPEQPTPLRTESPTLSFPCEEVEMPQVNPQASLPVIPGPSTSTSFSVSRKVRRRVRPATQADLRNRVFRLETEKKEVLEGILREMREININLKKLIEKLY
ncbi:uncharacterized protein LOC119189819 [Manduca sexta]|uniref:uncharacterized protein LOC119189819 n=1 Tax=Manduca sexta TaxID=7130 RepID=UPI0018902BC3|nr:uncharacterized protein LOC119189819 [Manduca sexta]